MKRLLFLFSLVLSQLAAVDYYQNWYPEITQKSQVDQSGGNSTLVGSVARALGNGRICWTCDTDAGYTACLADTIQNGDALRHGASYCQGEDYFCFISERRIIRHDENDFNFEYGAPWSADEARHHQERLNGFPANSDGAIKVTMGCQQPLSCLRQQWQNYQIVMGKSFYHGYNATLVDEAYVPAGSQTEVRSGLCRHYRAWQDYASGIPSGSISDSWRRFSWMEEDTQSGNGKSSQNGWGDRRFGSIERWQHRGKGTESVCYYCCDPYLDYNAKGCNHVAATAFKSAVGSSGLLNGSPVEGNIFLAQPSNSKSSVWSGPSQYHGAFRNPHTQVAKESLT
ncbi:Oidioi.mRNA.OKI2018_I69.chr2.g4376.t1.cds [Oikopleura dioica]|uniref:Oidioi.mRNA.OKI2018_I69.chr2.g4376.t1.cds n=1 Tax=Oikopleura dioica TaxID=34765 RepID=A0ABN7SWR5_OIKDI|nr:Oidioi.mRNA.OKI2018_I69.chr2.g4376.t1.cds [Oikopleura dioica]